MNLISGKVIKRPDTIELTKLDTADEELLAYLVHVVGKPLVFNGYDVLDLMNKAVESLYPDLRKALKSTGIVPLVISKNFLDTKNRLVLRCRSERGIDTNELCTILLAKHDGLISVRVAPIDYQAEPKVTVITAEVLTYVGPKGASTKWPA